MLDRRRQLAAERSRRWYARRKQGKLIVPVEIDEVETEEALRAAGLLDGEATPEAIGEAIQRAISLWTA